MALRSQESHLERDLLLLTISIIATVACAYYGIFDAIFLLLADQAVTASFIAGLFFTSLFTIAPALVAFGELSHFLPLIPLAGIGAIGATIGDLLLFFFVRDIVSLDLKLVINSSWRRYLAHTFSHPLLQWLVPVVGAIIIASPLPDELGIALLGLNRTRLVLLIPISFAMNFLGISIIWLALNVT